MIFKDIGSLIYKSAYFIQGKTWLNVIIIIAKVSLSQIFTEVFFFLHCCTFSEKYIY